MNFNSASYLLFLFTAAVLNRLLPKYNKIFILLCSLFFLGLLSWHVIAVALFLTWLNFLFCSRLLLSSSRHSIEYPLFITFNVLVLLFSNYIIDVQWLNLHTSIRWMTIGTSKWVGIFGISYYQLQNIANLIDARKKILQKPAAIDFFLHNLFFARFVVGPITPFRLWGKNFISVSKPINQIDIAIGTQRIMIGFLKKVVLADRIGLSTNIIFNDLYSYSGIEYLAGGLLFTLQLYFDFSGLCDIAVGSARLFGIELKENFNLPLRADSIAEFWRRWHITLMNFLNQYVFTPLAYRFRRMRKQGIVIAIWIVFAISAVWHGISYTFFIWAFLHAFYLTVETFSKQQRMNWKKKIRYKKVYHILCVAVTLCAVCFSNIFFAIPTDKVFHYILKSFSSITQFTPGSFRLFLGGVARNADDHGIFTFIITIILTLVFILVEKKIYIFINLGKFSVVLMFLILLLIFTFGIIGDSGSFLYTRF
jgi:alginate O-acetyltransferase complex protein AlgI